MAADNIMSIEQATEQMPSHQADLAALYQSYVGALLTSSQALIGSCQTMQGALLAFLQSRAKESLSAGKRLAARTRSRARLDRPALDIGLRAICSGRTRL